MQNQKRAGLGAERLEEECKGPGSGQYPGSGGQAPTWSPGMAELKKPVLTQSGQAACQGLQGAVLCGKVPPAVLDSGLTSAPNSQALCPAGSSQAFQFSHPLLSSKESEALPVRKRTGDLARLGSAQTSSGVKDVTAQLLNSGRHLKNYSPVLRLDSTQSQRLRIQGGSHWPTRSSWQLGPSLLLCGTGWW